MDELDELKQIIFREMGDAILNRRKDLGLTQKQLADMAGYSDCYQCMVEDGKKNVTLAYLISISLALQCEPLELIEDVMRSIHDTTASTKRYNSLKQQALQNTSKNMHIKNNK